MQAMVHEAFHLKWRDFSNMIEGLATHHQSLIEP
jgi:hypothetical protein